MTLRLLLLSLLAAPAGAQEIEEFEPAPTSSAATFEAAPSAPITRVYGEGRLLTALDTSFDSPEVSTLAERIFEVRGRLKLGADVKLSERLRVMVEGRAFWRVTTQRGFERSKGTFDPYLGETFVDIYSSWVDLRVGSQVLSFGANPALAPADALNPRDLREGFLLSEPEDAKLPVLAVRALGTVGKVQWTAVYAPFFIPHRYDVFGQDQALLQPSLGVVAALPSQLQPSIEDELQPHLLETERPAGFGWFGDVGLRATTQAGKVTLGASWNWMNEKLPQVTIDPELAQVLAERQAGREDLAGLVSLRQRAEAGEPLVRGRYQRQHILSLEGAFLLGPTQVDLDLSYSPLQTFYDVRGRPARKKSVTWVVGLTQAEDSKLLYSVSYLGIAIPGTRADELLALVEPATAQGAPRTAFLHLFVGNIAYAFLNGKLEISARAAFEPIQRSYAFAPQVAYKPVDTLKIFAGTELLQGPSLSPFGYFDRNDQVVVGVSGRFF
ncbi:MAG: hypothetical protein ACT4TC_05060 [Myxococcaceae bacterium]